MVKKTLSTPPVWFKLEKYKAFTREENDSYTEFRRRWANALFARHQVLKWLELGLPEVADFVARLVKDPTDNCGFAAQFSDRPTEVGAGLGQRYSQGTAWATRRKDLNTFLQDGWASDEAGDAGKSPFLDDVYWEAGATHGPKGFVTINLAASDEQIKRDFSAWLAAVRRVRSLKPLTGKGPEALLERWSTYKLLPYIDLMCLWAPVHGVEIQRLDAVAWLNPHATLNSRRDFATRTLPKMVDLALDPQIINLISVSANQP